MYKDMIIFFLSFFCVALHPQFITFQRKNTLAIQPTTNKKTIALFDNKTDLSILYYSTKDLLFAGN